MKTIAFIRASNIYDDSRATKEIKALVEAGYKVFVLGWNRDGVAEEKTNKIFDKSNVKTFFYNASAKNGIGFRNISKLLMFFLWVYKTLRKLKNIEVVHSCDLDTGVSAFLFCKIHKKKLVYDIYDYYIDSHHMPKCIGHIVEKIEIAVINFADATIICTEERMEQIAKSTPQKTIVIHNSPDVEAVVDEKKEYDYAYCGALCDMRLLNEILSEYPNHSSLRFCFAGYGEFSTIAEKNSSGYPNFFFKGPISYSEVLDVERRSACLAAIYEPTIRNHRLCAPNKFYEALALAKPIIVCKGTGIDKIVQENEIGFVIDYDASQFYAVVEKIKNNPEVSALMGHKARVLYEKKYKWSVMKQRLVKLYKELA